MRVQFGAMIGIGFSVMISLTGCSTTRAGAGSTLSRVFVPPPPISGGSSTITVVPAKTSRGKQTQGKSWGNQETVPQDGADAGGSSSRKIQASAAAISPTPEASLPLRANMNSPRPSAGKEVPVPVLYDRPEQRVPQSSPGQPETGNSYDPRLSS